MTNHFNTSFPMRAGTVFLLLDDGDRPIVELAAPVSFELDTHKPTDRDHLLTIVSGEPGGKEGIRKIPIVFRSGPAIVVEGIKVNTIVDGVLPLFDSFR